jgi:hypothetical protein
MRQSFCRDVSVPFMRLPKRRQAAALQILKLQWLEAHAMQQVGQAGITAQIIEPRIRYEIVEKN